MTDRKELSASTEVGRQVTGDMKTVQPRFLLLEPYYGGSHRAFIQGMQRNLTITFTVLSMPAHKWKMRMQLAAPWFAEETGALIRSGERFDGILCSTFLDSALLKALLCKQNIHLPLLIYFHENQFAYPNRLEDPAGYQFSALNFTSALAADRLAFNSRYNFDTFIRGMEKYLKKSADIQVTHLAGEVAAKSEVLYPGIDFSAIDRQKEDSRSEIPVIVWNHRWEHDKDPATFFKAMGELAQQEIDFRLVILGQSFVKKPVVFERAMERLNKNIIHIGYVKSRTEYARLLRRGNIVVSTARQEFFGMSVLEGVRAGCLPVVPDRLAYQEIFPGEYRYRSGELVSMLKKRLARSGPMAHDDIVALTEKFSWPNRVGAFESWLRSIL